MRLSIVIPCYNVISYLPECLESVLGQETDRVEIIVVNDGSTDGTDLLLNEYEGKYTNLVIVQKENGGLSSARNAGLELATGDYIAMLDGDDLYKKNAIKKIIACLDKNEPDLLILDFERIWDDNGIQSNDSIPRISKNCLQDATQESLISKLYDHGEFFAWRYIFKRKCFNNIRYPIGKNFEDVRIFSSLISRCTNYFYLPLVVVSYRQRSGSILKTKSISNTLALATSNEVDSREPFYLFSQEDMISYTVFSLKTYIWATSDALKCSDTKACLQTICGSYKKCLLVPLNLSLKKLKMIDRRSYVIFKLLTFSDFIYIHGLSLYKDSRVISWMINKLYRLIR